MEVFLSILPHFPPQPTKSIHETTLGVKLKHSNFKVDSVVKVVAEHVRVPFRTSPYAGCDTVFAHGVREDSNRKTTLLRVVTAIYSTEQL